MPNQPATPESRENAPLKQAELDASGVGMLPLYSTQTDFDAPVAEPPPPQPAQGVAEQELAKELGVPAEKLADVLVCGILLQLPDLHDTQRVVTFICDLRRDLAAEREIRGKLEAELAKAIEMRDFALAQIQRDESDVAAIMAKFEPRRDDSDTTSQMPVVQMVRWIVDKLQADLAKAREECDALRDALALARSAMHADRWHIGSGDIYGAYTAVDDALRARGTQGGQNMTRSESPQSSLRFPRVVAYVAGPFRAYAADGSPCHFGIAENVLAAARVARACWQSGVAAVCPHMNTATFQGSAPDETFLDGDLDIMRRCDCVVLTPDWRRSSGACREVEVARSIGMPVFDNVEDMVEYYEQRDRIAAEAAK